MTRLAAVLAAAGRGARVGGPTPKQLVTLAGRTVLEWAVESFDAHPDVVQIVVVLPAAQAVDPPPGLLARATPVTVVAGGARRQDSVAAGVAAVTAEVDVVVIHDAARPFCTGALITRTAEAASEAGAAIPALAARDTVKRTRGDGEAHVVDETLARERIYLAQTPQAFLPRVLDAALEAGRQGMAGTDEATLAERAGHPVRIVEGDPANFKITTPHDLEVARAMLAKRSSGSPELRVGLGYDLHRLAEGRRLVLGGVEIPAERGLDGHSDADVVCHAVTDAVLGAAGAGDIGGLFPNTDAAWKDASSVELLARAVAVLRERGGVVRNVDVVVITDWPKIKDHAAEMRRHLGGALAVDPERVSIKGKTSEGVGAFGRGEAIAVHAVATVELARAGESDTC